MRIAMFTGSSYPPTDGIGAYSSNLAHQLVRRGHEVTIITRGRVDPVGAWMGGVKFVRFPGYPIYPFHLHAHTFSVNRYLARVGHRFDLFHAHSPLAPVLRGVDPVVTTIHSPLSEHQPKVHDLLSLLTKLQLPFSRSAERRLLMRSRAVAVVNPLLAREVAARLGGKVPVTALANGVDTGRFVPDRSRRDPMRVAFVGRLQHGKGLEDLLAAWPQVLARQPGARLEIVGSGPLEPKVRTLTRRKEVVGTVRLAGPAVSDALVHAYQTATIIVQPSHHEGLSTVLLEAMAVGAIVIATNVGGHRTLIQHGVDGLLVPPSDPTTLSDAIASVLADGQAQIMGMRARKKMETSYSWPRITEAYEAWYVSALPT